MEQELNALFEEYHKRHHFSGAALVKRSENVIFSKAYGYAHKGFKVPNTAQTMFDTASITKLFTAVAILQLVDKGALRLEDRIAEILDLRGTQIPADVTIAQLLTHTSGIADDADEELGESYEDLFIHKPNYAIRNNEDFIPQFAYKEPKFKAGTDVSYNNCAFVLLGLAIERITKENYRSYVERNIFQICGMSSTRFHAKDDAELAVAEGYAAVSDEAGNLVWKKNMYSFPPVGTADGGAYTSVGDLDLFMRALLNRKLLSSGMTLELLKPQTSMERDFEWGKMVNGYGFHFKYDTHGELIQMFKDGCNAGVAAMFAYYPGADVTSVILANQTCNVWELHRITERIWLADLSR